MVNADTVAGATVGAAAVASSIASVAMGYPTGAMGQAFWDANQMMTVSMGIFGVLAMTVMGGVGLAMVSKHQDDKYAHELATRKYRHAQADDEDSDDEDFIRQLRRHRRRHGLTQHRSRRHRGRRSYVVTKVVY